MFVGIKYRSFCEAVRSLLPDANVILASGSTIDCKKKSKLDSELNSKKNKLPIRECKLRMGKINLPREPVRIKKSHQIQGPAITLALGKFR